MNKKELIEKITPAPCPFCGGKPRSYCAATMVSDEDLELDIEEVTVSCTPCNVTLPFTTWQKRAPLQTVIEYINGIRELTPDVKQRMEETAEYMRPAFIAALQQQANKRDR